MSTATALAFPQTQEQREVYFEARRYCDEHEGSDQAKVMASMLHRAFLRDTEYLRQIAARAAAMFLQPRPHLLRSDGSLTPLEVPLRPELAELLQRTDESIAMVAARYGLTVDRQASTVSIN